jgi:hypothetical protein
LTNTEEKRIVTAEVEIAEDLFDLSEIAAAAPPTEARKRTSMLLYGRHRVGKSTFVSQCAEVDGMWPVAWIATEDGTGAFAGKYDDRIDVFHARDTTTVVQLAEALAFEKTKYRTVVIDTAGEFQEIIKRDYQSANPNAKNAFEVWDKVANGLSYVSTILHNSKLNFFLIAHTAKEKDDVLGQILLSPHFLGKKSVVEIPKIPDTIAYLEKKEDDEGNGYRLLHLTASGRIDAGSRYEHKLPDHMVNPKMSEYYTAITA